MLTPTFLAKIPERMVRMYAQVEEDIIADMARRIATYDYFIPSAEHQFRVLQEYGNAYDEIVRRLSSKTGRSTEEIKRLMSEAGSTTLKNDKRIYERAGIKPLSASPRVQALLQIGAIQTAGEFKNLTRTAALGGAKQYVDVLDRAFMQITSGAFDHETAIRGAIKHLAEKGVQTVGYASGRTMSLEGAVMLAVTTGVNSNALAIQNAYMDEMGCDLVETTAHAGARPAHAQWQGKVFSRSGTHPKYPPLTEGTGYGTGAGLGGWNCRHSMFPFFEGASEPTYTREELEEYNKAKYEYNGKKLTEYEAVSERGRIERNIRRWKREYVAMDAAGLDTTEAAIKVKSWRERAKDFTKQTGLKGRLGDWGIKDAPRLTAGRSDHTPKKSIPKFVGKIDTANARLVKSKLREFEDSVVGEPIEHAYVILANGKTYRFAGDACGVDPSALGESLKGAIVSHNHPIEETPFSFSEDDFAFFQKYGLLELNGVDEKYHYTLKRDLPAAMRPELENLTLADMNEELYCHYLTYNRAKEANIYYERAARAD